MKYIILLLLAVGTAFGKDVKVEVSATHAVTREDRSARAIVDRGFLGANVPNRQSESFNVDAIINGEHVALVCEDTKGCESPALGIYDAELKKDKWLKISFTLPVSQKRVARWYRIAGTW